MTLLIGERYKSKLAEPLAAQGVQVIWLPDNPALDERLRGHADLSVFVSGRHAVVAQEIYPYIVNKLTNIGYSVAAAEEQGAEYPNDVGLCICDTGKYTIFNPKTADPAAVAITSGQPVTVSQGYTKCAALIVNEQSIITSDAGVWRAAKNAGMDVLQIEPGFIELKGYDHGFIGGASFKLNENTIAFTGTLDAHPNREQIYAFLAERGQKPVILTDELIFDIGGAITLP